MSQLAPADVANLRCRFASELYKHLKCEKYSLSCCIDNAVEAFLNYKISSGSCSLDVDTVCRLNSYKKLTTKVVCGEEIPCSGQAVVDVNVSVMGNKFAPSIINSEYYLSGIQTQGKATMNLVGNSIYQSANIQVGLVDPDTLIVLDTAFFFDGWALVNGTPIYSPDLYSTKAGARFAKSNLQSYATGFIRTLRIYYTSPVGQFVPGQFWDLNLDPYTTTWRTCGTCTPVALPDLLFGSPNWEVAIKTLVDNAIRELTGDDANIDFEAKQVSNIDETFLITWIKHLPNSIWCGMQSNDMLMSYWNGVGYVKVSNTDYGSPFITQSGNMYGTHTFTTDCGVKEVSVGNVAIQLLAHAQNSKFNEIVLWNNPGVNIVSLNDSSQVSCMSTTAKVNVLPFQDVILIEWLDEFGAVIDSGLNTTFTPTSTGLFTCRVTLASGCVITVDFIVEYALAPVSFLLAEDGAYIITEDNKNIAI